MMLAPIHITERLKGVIDKKVPHSMSLPLVYTTLAIIYVLMNPLIHLCVKPEILTP